LEKLVEKIMIKLKDLIKEDCGCGSSCCSTKKESVNEKTFTPEKRRKLKSGEIEIMKGKGSRQTWFYVKNKADAQRLVRLGRNSGFPTGITKNNSREKLDKGFFIKESINEANPEAMVGKKLGALLKSLDKTVAQYKKKANVKNHMNFFEAGVKNVMRKHGIK